MTTKIETDAKGIPLKSSYPASPPYPVFYTMITTVFTVITFAIAYYAVVKNNDKGDAKIAIVSEYDLGYLYLAAFILKIGQHIMNINLGSIRKEAKVNVPDQHVYQVKGAEGSKLGYVLLEYDGLMGKFNRAQRAIMNYNETYAQNVLYILLSGIIYSKEVCIICTIFACTRVLYAIGYTYSVNGREAGFMLSLLTAGVIEGLVVIAGYKAIQM